MPIRERAQRALTSVVIALGSVQVIAGLAGFFHRTVAGLDPVGYGVYVVELAVFGSAAGLLLYAGRDDRTRHLGGFFLLAASAFAPSLYAGFAETGSSGLGVAERLLATLVVEAYLPAFLWLFVADFPRTVGAYASRRIATTMAALSLVAGTCLVATNGGAVLSDWAGHSAWPSLAPWTRDASGASGGLYWAVVFALLLPALPFGLWRTRWAPAAERSRAFFFYGVIAAGFSPLTLENVLEAFFPPFQALIRNPTAFRISQWIVYPALIAIPLATTYALLVDRVPTLGLALRKAARYMLARFVLLNLSFVPLVALGLYLFLHRREALSSILGGVSPWLLVFMAMLGLAGLARRDQMLQHLDRQFFRERYDAARILERLVGPQGAPRSRDPERFLKDVIRELDEALHPTHAVLFARSADERSFLPPRGAGMPPLDGDSTLAAMLRRRPGPLSVRLWDDDSALSRLPEPEVDWLIRGDFQLLMPLFGGSDRLLAILALGPRRSELPYSREDRAFLGTIARTAGLVLESSGTTGVPPRSSVEVEPPAPASDGDGDGDAAMECARCGRLHEPDADVCKHCGGEVRRSPVPLRVGSRYLLERRLGAGGMGLVYRAFDLDLKRRVAVKTVARGSASQSARIKQEAQAMAAVGHPNLATIYGIERWHDSWLLFMEYVDDRTLAEVLEEGPLDPRITLEMGAKLADALSTLHRAGLLHRDVKPGNIGFMRTGDVKLLDFGVVRIFARGPSPDTVDVTPGTDTGGEVTTSRIATTAGKIVGSPLYLSPEVLSGAEPDPQMDLWALSLVLYECIAGHNPLRGSDLGETVSNITRGRVPDLRELAPACPGDAAAVLMRGLDPDPGRRFRSAGELREALRETWSRV